MSQIILKRVAALSIMLAPFVHVSTGMAESEYIDLHIAGEARDIGSGQVAIEGQFSVHDGIGHYWNADWGAGAYRTVDLDTGTVTNIGAPGTILTNGYGDPFGMYDSTTNAFYAATYYGSGESYVYKYDYATASWSEGIKAVNIYGGDFYNGQLYIAGLREPWSGGYDSNYVSLFDFSGNGYHDALIETGGASAHVALDTSGNVYYATYDPSGAGQLFRWSADQVSTVVNDLAGGAEDTFLTLADGEKLTNLPGGANGITVDEAGHVFVTTNGSNATLLMWSGLAGDGDNYEVIGTNSDGLYAWFGPLDIEGNFLQGDALYGSYGFNGGITEITATTEPVPVPAAAWLLGSGLLGLAGIRRRRQ